MSGPGTDWEPRLDKFNRRNGRLVGDLNEHLYRARDIAAWMGRSDAMDGVADIEAAVSILPGDLGTHYERAVRKEKAK